MVLQGFTEFWRVISIVFVFFAYFFLNFSNWIGVFLGFHCRPTEREENEREERKTAKQNKKGKQPTEIDSSTHCAGAHWPAVDGQSSSMVTEAFRFFGSFAMAGHYRLCACYRVVTGFSFRWENVFRLFI